MGEGLLNIEQVTGEPTGEVLNELIKLIQDAVESGASVGFLPPLPDDLALAYWREVLEGIKQGTRVLLVARRDQRVVGTVQLALAAQQNTLHRAEVQKIVFHTSMRRQGIGEALMVAIEETARAAGRTVLVLDTRHGDESERLYHKQGYRLAGTIPQHARSASGALDSTAIYYRLL